MIENKYFLQNVLADVDSYWVVAKLNTSRQYFEDKRMADDICLISISGLIEGLGKRKFEDLTLREIETACSKEIATNIFFTTYSPFQFGQSLRSFYDGFPLDSKKINIRKFIIEAMKLESADLDDYKKLMKECLK